jgi:hypothetical protein
MSEISENHKRFIREIENRTCVSIYEKIKDKTNLSQYRYCKLIGMDSAQFNKLLKNNQSNS